MMNRKMMEGKLSMELNSAPDHVCYVRCNFCNTVLAVVIPCKRLLETITVKCGHCGNVSFLSTRPLPPTSTSTHTPLQPQSCLDQSLITCTPQGFNFLEKTCSSDTNHSSSSSTLTNDPDSPRPFVCKPPEKKHRLPSAYNRFMKEEIQRIKAANPEIPHREAFSTAAKNWARFLPHSPSAGTNNTN